MTVELNCPECDGNGTLTNPTGNCKNQSNDCCGGCSKEITCDTCSGLGTVEVDLMEEYDEQLATIGVLTTKIHKDLRNRGVSLTETKQLIRLMVEEIINEN